MHVWLLLPLRLLEWPEDTHQVCGGVGLQTWPLVTPDPSLLVPGFFLFSLASSGMWDREWKDLLFCGDWFLNGVSICFQNPCLSSRHYERACAPPSYNLWVYYKALLSSTFLFFCNYYTCKHCREHLNRHNNIGHILGSLCIRLSTIHFFLKSWSSTEDRTWGMPTFFLTF